jgi:hypothetical protein
VVTISSPENLADLERYQGIQARLADPRAIEGEAEAREAVPQLTTENMVRLLSTGFPSKRRPRMIRRSG